MRVLFLVLVLVPLCTYCSDPYSVQSTNEKVTSAAALPQEKTPVEANDETYDTQALNDSDLSQLSIDKLAQLYTSKKNQNVAEIEELEQLESLNSALCERLEKLRQECVAAVNVVPSNLDRELQCNGSYADSKVRSYQFEVTLSGASGKYHLEVNDSYKSSSFSSGTTTISFTVEGSAATLSPQFKQVSKMRLVSDSDTTSLSNPSQIGFKLKINEQVLVSKPLLFPDDASLRGKVLKINLGEIQNQALSSECRVLDPEIQAIKEQIRLAVQDQQAQKKMEEYSKSKGESEVDLTKRSSLITAQIKLRGQIEERLPVLEASRQRNLKLVQELKADTQLGCQLEQPIKELKIEVSGSYTGISDVISTQSAPRLGTGTEGECATLEFKLGEDISFAVNQTERSIVGTPPVSYIAPDLSHIKIENIKYLQVSKKSICFDNVEKKKQVFIISESTYYETREKHMFKIEGIKVFVNSTLAYDNPNINKTFNRDNTNIWVDKGFRLNDNWIKLVQSEDCNVSE